MFVNKDQSFACQIAATDDRVALHALDERRTILVLGQGPGATYLSTMAERAGLHSLGGYTPHDVQAQFGWSASVDLILLDLRGGAMLEEVDALTAWLGASKLSVLVDLDGLDHALAALDGPGTDFLCNPTDGEIVTMLVMAGLSKSSPRHGHVHDAARDGEVARLEQLSQDVRRLAVTIERMSSGFSRGLPGGAKAEERPDMTRTVARSEGALAVHAHRPWEQRLAHVDTAADAAPTHAEVRALIRARRMRDQFFPADIFADPAWDMMLDLMAARLAGQRVSVSSLCIAAAVPPTTALRWIRQLADRAMFVRIDDPLDGRRVFIDLTETATQAVFGWVRAVRRNGGLLAAG